MTHQFSPLSEKLKNCTLNGECWEYNGCTNNYGYCLIMVDRKLQYAHRLSYQFHKGPIPDGMTVDHICFNRKCINSQHLRLSKPGDNNGRHRTNGLKARCEKHQCRRRLVYQWSSKTKKAVRRTICPKCQSEYSSNYKRRKKMHGNPIG